LRRSSKISSGDPNPSSPFYDSDSEDGSSSGRGERVRTTHRLRSLSDAFNSMGTSDEEEPRGI